MMTTITATTLDLDDHTTTTTTMTIHVEALVEATVTQEIVAPGATVAEIATTMMKIACLLGLTRSEICD